MSDRIKAEQCKTEGNHFFKNRKWADAVKKYTEGIAADPSYHLLYSNRSQAYFNMNDFASAVHDGELCIQTSPKSFVKGYYRLANAQFALRDYKGALMTCKKAESNGFRGNKDINDLYDKCKPLAEKQELDELAKLTGHARAKAQGNMLFKNGRYEQAIEWYTKVCDCISDQTTDAKDKSILISCLNNRALCHMQQQNYRNVVLDTSRSIAIDDTKDNIKAYFRRATAFEGLEKYRSALADIRFCTLHKPNWPAANKAQHRLDTSVRKLRQHSRY